MADYGGLGGISEGRAIDEEDLFEKLLNDQFGQRIKTDDEFCKRLWGSLANIDWRHKNGDTAAYSFRAAGDLIAAIRGEGNYMDWYMSGSSGLVDLELEEKLSEFGWEPFAL